MRDDIIAARSEYQAVDCIAARTEYQAIDYIATRTQHQANDCIAARSEYQAIDCIAAHSEHQAILSIVKSLSKANVELVIMFSPFETNYGHASVELFPFILPFHFLHVRIA
jgi:hypothetical protein